MRKTYKSIIPLGFLLLTCFGLGGCTGGASPPASLPAPVSQLISVGNPDSIGLVSVFGAAGSVLPNALVRAQNLTQTAANSSWMDLLIPLAMAQGSDPTVSVEADNLGQFELGIKADVGDTILVQQLLDGEQSPNVDLKVNGNVVRLPVLPRGFTEPEPGLLSVTGAMEKSPDGELFDIDFAENPSPPSFPAAVQTFNACPGINGVVIDAEDGLGSLLCKENESLVNFSPDGDIMAQFQEIDGVRFIGGRPERNQGVLGVAKIDASVVTFNTATGSLQCDYLIPHPGGKAKHLQTTRAEWLDLDNTGVDSVLLALSQYDDGSWVLTRFQPLDCTNFAILNQMELPADLNPFDMDGYQFGEQALISIPDSNRVLLVDLDRDTFASIPVGKSPLGVAVSQNQSTAYVVNNDDNSLTRIDLLTLATNDIPAVGIFPTQIQLLESLGLGTVLSSGDRAVVTFPLD